MTATLSVEADKTGAPNTDVAALDFIRVFSCYLRVLNLLADAASVRGSEISVDGS